MVYRITYKSREITGKGIHSYPFAFRLPSYCPPSFNRSFNVKKKVIGMMIHYKISARVELPSFGGESGWNLLIHGVLDNLSSHVSTETYPTLYSC